MNLSLTTCFIQISDPDEALGFYRDALGLEVHNDVDNGGFRWITVGVPGEGVSIVLSNYVAGSPEDIDTVSTLLAKGALNGAHFSTDELDGLFEKLTDAGVDIVSEPADQPWGVRDCAVRDPAGNLIRIDQTPA